MPRSVPSPLAQVLAILRTRRGWSQKELAQAGGVRPQVISDFEKGRRELERDQLDALARVMGCVSEEIDLALVFNGVSFPSEADASPIGPTEDDLRRARVIASRVGLTEAGRTYALLLDVTCHLRIGQARRLAEHQWHHLRTVPASQLCDLIAASPDLHHWALVERLCEESVHAAADDSALAVHLATAALRIAELTAGHAAWRSALQGHAWAFVANAQRVAIDLIGAEKSFDHAWRCWRAGAVQGVAWPLAQWRLLDLQASLRRDQRRFPEALALLDRALRDAPVDARSRILVNKGYVLEQAGEIDAALAVLEETALLVEPGTDPNLRWSLEVNRIVLLAHLGRFTEANDRLSALRTLATSLKRRLHLSRVTWLKGRIEIGLGRRGAGRALFEQARREFLASNDAADAALVALELAVLDLEDGHWDEVAASAQEIASLFRALRVGREALVASRFFLHAARARTATTAMAQRLIAQLTKWERESRTSALPPP
jgi:transcriptional regulator with XRE-family HTH domain